MIKKYYLCSIPILFFLGIFSHFAFELLGNFSVMGIIFPVNESIYEHTKLGIFPYMGFYIFLYIKNKDNLNKILNYFIISLFIFIITIPLLFYFYTSAFNFESVIIDIIIYLISIIISNIITLHLYKYKEKLLDIRLGLIIITFYFVFNYICLYKPPKYPIFIDNTTNSYGIKH